MNDVSVNQQIAELLGWTVERFQLGDMPVDWFVLRDPARRIQYGAVTDAEAWAGLPDYERSLDAVAAALPSPATLELSDWVDGEFYAQLTWLDADGKEFKPFVAGWGATRADAAARALLAYATAQKGATP